MKKPFRQFKQGDRVRTPEGMGTLSAFYNNDPNRVNHWLVDLENGEQVVYHKYNLTPETFGEFLTRPGHVGRWSHRDFAIVSVFLLALIAAGIVTWNDKGWIAIVAAFGILAFILWGMWMNWSRRML